MQGRPLLDHLVHAAGDVLQPHGACGRSRGRAGVRAGPLRARERGEMPSAHRALAWAHRGGGVALQDLGVGPALAPRLAELRHTYVFAQADDAPRAELRLSGLARRVGPCGVHPRPGARGDASSRVHPGSTTSPAPTIGRSAPIRSRPSRGAYPSEITRASHAIGASPRADWRVTDSTFPRPCAEASGPPASRGCPRGCDPRGDPEPGPPRSHAGPAQGREVGEALLRLDHDDRAPPRHHTVRAGHARRAPSEPHARQVVAREDPVGSRPRPSRRSRVRHPPPGARPVRRPGPGGRRRRRRPRGARADPRSPWRAAPHGAIRSRRARDPERSPCPPGLRPAARTRLAASTAAAFAADSPAGPPPTTTTSACRKTRSFMSGSRSIGSEPTPV